NKIVDLRIHNLRDWTTDKHHIVDDAPFGGGQGMVMKPEPIFAAVEELQKSAIKNQKSKIILMSPGGRRLDQKLATELSKESHLTVVCGHYEGVDHRVIDHLVDFEVSIGDYVLTNGAIAAVVLLMRSCDCYLAFSVTSNQRWTIPSVPVCSKRRSIRDRLNFVAGKFLKPCFPEITPRSRSGEKSRRSSGPNKIA